MNKKLIIVASSIEAEPIIKKFNMIQNNDQLYKSNEIDLIITGVGVFHVLETLNNINHIINNYSEWINIGIAGQVNASTIGVIYKIGQIAPIELKIEQNPHSIQFIKSLYPIINLDKDGHSLFTSQKPVYINSKEINKTLPEGSIIDMEGYWIGKFASSHNIKLSMYKCISDDCLEGSEGLIMKHKDRWTSSMTNFQYLI
jgi:nucleoside phosphorylase